MQRRRPKLKLKGHYMMIDGQRVEIDPHQTDLPDRCLLALAEMATGQQYELVDDPEQELSAHTLPE